MLGLPKWLIDCMNNDDFICPQCSSKFDKDGVDLVGVRNSHKDKKIQVVCILYKCKKCSQETLLELPFEVDLAEFSLMVLEDYEDQVLDEMAKSKGRYSKKTSNNKAKKKSKSGITKDEVNKAIELMNKCKTWEDLLEEIGAPMEFAFYKKEDDK